MHHTFTWLNINNSESNRFPFTNWGSHDVLKMKILYFSQHWFVSAQTNPKLTKIFGFSWFSVFSINFSQFWQFQQFGCLQLVSAQTNQNCIFFLVQLVNVFNTIFDLLFLLNSYLVRRFHMFVQFFFILLRWLSFYLEGFFFG